MLHYPPLIAGPVFTDIPSNSPLTIAIVLSLLMVGLAALVAVRLSVKIAKSSPQTANYQTTQVSSSKNYIVNYIISLIIDVITVGAIFYAIAWFNIFGQWNNETWHRVIIYFAGSVVVFRVLFRIFVKRTPGEIAVRQNAFAGVQNLEVAAMDSLLAVAIFLLNGVKI